MKRSIGLTLVGILILSLSALMLFGAVVGGVFMWRAPMLQSAPNTPPPEQMRAMSILGIAALGVMAMLGAAIGVGILRLWSWARYTAVVIGFLVGGISVFSGLILFMMPMPETPGTTPGSTTQIRIGIALFYFFWAFLYVSVSIYLLRASVGEQFRRGGMTENQVQQENGIHQESKPLAVLTVAGLTLMSLLSLPYFLFMDFPVLLFGVEFSGVAGKIGIMLWILLFGVVGIALIRRVKRALWLALGLYGLSIVNGLLVFRDGVLARYYQHIPKYGPYDPQFSARMLQVMMLLGVLSAVIPITLLLVGKRKYFAWCDRKQLAVAPPAV